MALLGNQSVLNKNPGKAFGPGYAVTRASSAKPGSLQARFTGRASYDPKSATPNGHLPSSSFILPIKPGGMSAYTSIEGGGSITGNLAGGVNISAALAGSGTIASAVGSLIASATAALSGSGSITGDLQAVLNAVAALSGSGSISGTLRADAYMEADLTGVGTLAATIRAIGHLEADLTPFGDTSPQAIALAVWEVVAAEVNAAGTTGQALNIIKAVLANRVYTDDITGTFIVYDENDAPLYSGDLWKDNGTTPFDGTGGAVRRDRLQ